MSEQDVDLAGIDIVVNTHLHFDHCGGNHLFAGRPIYVQRRELDDARGEDDYTIREWVDAPGVRYVPVDGELELLPGLRLVPAPGHTRGMQVVVVETGGRPVVVGGDVAVWFGELDEPQHRGPAAGARARPRAGLARARARAMATLGAPELGHDGTARRWSTPKTASTHVADVVAVDCSGTGRPSAERTVSSVEAVGAADAAVLDHAQALGQQRAAMMVGTSSGVARCSTTRAQRAASSVAPSATCDRPLAEVRVRVAVLDERA